MTKNTMGTKLPRKLEQKMPVVGEQIKLARLRRNLSVAQVAERATCSPLTVSRIEKGAPTVSIGIYLRLLYALQLDDDILWLAKEDKLGRALQDLSLKTRERALLLRREQIAASEEGRQVRRLSSFDYLTGIDDIRAWEASAES